MCNACPFLPIAIYGKMHRENANGIMENSTFRTCIIHSVCALVKLVTMAAVVCVALMETLRYKLSDFFIQWSFSYADYYSIKVQNTHIHLHSSIGVRSPNLRGC